MRLVINTRNKMTSTDGDERDAQKSAVRTAAVTRRWDECDGDVDDGGDGDAQSWRDGDGYDHDIDSGPQ